MRPAGRRGPARALVGVVAALVGLVVSSACTPARYSADADREVGGILDDYQDRALSGRAKSVRMPEAVKTETPKPSADAAAVAAPAVPMRLDLATSLLTALHESRDYKSQREGLYLSGLGFTLTQFNYGPKFSSTVNYLWGKSEGAPESDSAGATFGVSQLLPTNGQIALTSGITRTFTRGQAGGTSDWSNNLGLALNQPLLRGFGYDQYREQLTQGERNMVYAVRSFELFREGFVIDTAQQFFDLVRQKRQLANQESQLDKALYDVNLNNALRKVDRNRIEDVAQAIRQKISVEQTVLDARTQYRTAIEAFLIRLGLDPKTPVEIVEEEPPYEQVAFDPESVVDVAMNNRLDVMTNREQLEDFERNIVLQRQDFLPDMNLTAGAGLNGGGTAFSNASPDKWNASAGVSLNIPLQQINERNAYRQAEIGLDRARRNWTEFVDGVRAGVQSELRGLKNLEQQIDLDGQSIDDEARNVTRFDILLRNGEIGNRELVEARQRLLQSQNQLISDKISHFIARLRFYRDLGLLFVDGDGRWNVGAPVSEDRR